MSNPTARIFGKKFIRLRRMTYESTRRYGVKHSFSLIERIFERTIGSEMLCPKCSKKMIYHHTEGNRRDLVTIQHWESGEISFLCLECNSRHGASKNAKILDVPSGQKWCQACSTAKNKSEFYKNQHRTTGLTDYCKSCIAEHQKTK